MTSSDPRADGPLPGFDKLWNYSDPAATEAKFREILPRAEAGGSPAISRGIADAGRAVPGVTVEV